MKFLKAKPTQTIFLDREPHVLETYYQFMRDFKGECCFCELDRKLNKVIKETEHAIWFHNPFPYKNVKFHYQIIPKRHVERMDELNDEERLQVATLWAEATRGESIISLVRGPGATNRSIAHLHIHAFQRQF